MMVAVAWENWLHLATLEQQEYQVGAAGSHNRLVSKDTMPPAGKEWLDMIPTTSARKDAVAQRY